MIENLLTNLEITLMALLVYVVFWLANTIASLTLNIKVAKTQEWDKDKFLKSLWKLGGMMGTLILVTIGLSMVETDIFSIEALKGVIIAAALTKLAEAVTKIKDMFEYTTSIALGAISIEKEPISEPFVIEPVKEENNEDEYYKR